MKLRAAMVLAVAPQRPFTHVFAFNAALGQGQSAGAHGAVLTADALDTDVTGLHLGGTVKHRVNAQFLGPGDHLLGSGLSMDEATGSASLGVAAFFATGFLISAIRGSSSCLILQVK
jgi:hypothetical protein